MMTYLLKTSACVAVFYVVYLLLFRNTNRFQLNRAYLVVGLVLSFLVPVAVIPSVSNEMANTTIGQVFITGDTTQETGSAPVTSADVYLLTLQLYVIGAILALMLTLASAFKILRVYRSSDKCKFGTRTVMINPGIQPFSFFGIMFVRSPQENPMIVGHEMVHIRQRHWVDLLLVEMATIVLWFNPFIHFYKRSIVIQHEYIADCQVAATVAISDYLHCIARQLENSVLRTLTSNFHSRSIKQRIKMMTNPKTYSAFRYVIVLPLVVLLTMAFAVREHAPLQQREFRSPVDVSRLRKEHGAGFGMRKHPATHKEVFHTGVDFVTAAGNSVYAAGGGIVIETTSSGDRGNFIVIRHGKELATSYSHLEKIMVRKGDVVDKGQTIGLVGSTGLSTGPHLHFEVVKDGKAVDPVPYLNMSLD